MCGVQAPGVNYISSTPGRSAGERAYPDRVRDDEDEPASTHRELVRQVNIHHTQATPGIAWTREWILLAPESGDG